MSDEILSAKARLPMPDLLEKLGLGPVVANKARKCPLHDDKSPSFSVYQKEGKWGWKCHAHCGGGDEIDFLMALEGLDKAAAFARFYALAGVERKPNGKQAPAFDWAPCREAFDDNAAEDMSEWRGLTPAFCRWLGGNNLAGKSNGRFAFPVHNDAGGIIGCHIRTERAWMFEPKGITATALVIGNLRTANQVHVFESQWDAFSVCDKLKGHETPGVAFFITRGASNGSLVVGIPKGVKVLAWPQNDPAEKRDKDGNTPAEKWLSAVVQYARAGVRVVLTPPAHKDANDWVKDGNASPEDFLAAINAALPAGDPLTSIMDIGLGVPDPRKTVLGDRFLCIGGAMIFVGPSGIGKSSASMQQDILWSLGREAFGIRPARPLRILTIQAENDAEDLAEMREGVITGLDLSDRDRDAVRERVFYDTECGRTGAEFLKFVERRLSLEQFDILRIDPLQAYLGGDPKETEVTAEFLRTGLTPLLNRHGVACVLNHHTPKTNNRDTSDWRGSDWMYAGAGSADITNWARAAVIIDPTHAPHVFKFIAAKRGARVGWRDECGEKEIMRYFCHASEGLHWREATQEDKDEVQNAARASKSGEKPKTKEDLKALIPKQGWIAKNALLSLASTAGIGVNKARTFIGQLLTAQEAFEWAMPRPNSRPEFGISLHPQTLLGGVE